MSKDHFDAPTATVTAEIPPDHLQSTRGRSFPGIALVWRPREVAGDDRVPLQARFDVGRSSSSAWCIRDHTLSRSHLSFAPGAPGQVVVQDLGSRNGVYLDGHRLGKPVEVGDGAVIRAGGCVFVTVSDHQRLSPPGLDAEHYTITGRFHSYGLLQRLRVAARTGLHILVEGETGTGKELVVQALHRIFAELGQAGPLHSHNAALFAGEDDAVGYLFGVARGAFTNVEPREGALGLSHGGTFFLDELHSLPLRVQQALLRFAEDGIVEVLGGRSAPSLDANVDVRMVCGTNVDVDTACERGVLAHDLVSRLCRVRIAPLRQRRADIPSIFLSVVQKFLDASTADSIHAGIDTQTIERLCLQDYLRGNVRELVNLAVEAGAQVAEGNDASVALQLALESTVRTPSPSPDKGADAGSLSGSNQSSYKRHREVIISAYAQCSGNLSALEAVLRDQGISCNRKWLAIYLDRWGVRPRPKRRVSR